MLQNILVKAGAILESPEQPYQFMVHAVRTNIKSCLLTSFPYRYLYLLLNFFNNLLDPGRVYAPVYDKTFKRNACHLSSGWVKCRYKNRLRSIINNQVHPGQ